MNINCFTKDSSNNIIYLRNYIPHNGINYNHGDLLWFFKYLSILFKNKSNLKKISFESLYGYYT